MSMRTASELASIDKLPSLWQELEPFPLLCRRLLCSTTQPPTAATISSYRGSSAGIGTTSPVIIRCLAWLIQSPLLCYDAVVIQHCCRLLRQKETHYGHR